MILLTEQIRQVPCLIEKNFFEPDFTALAESGREFIKRDAKEIRLALKTAYQAEFRFPIDEPPFAEIAPDGSLRPRPENWHLFGAQTPARAVAETIRA